MEILVEVFNIPILPVQGSDDDLIQQIRLVVNGSKRIKCKCILWKG